MDSETPNDELNFSHVTERLRRKLDEQPPATKTGLLLTLLPLVDRLRLEEGHSLKQIWQMLHDEGVFAGSYEVFWSSLKAARKKRRKLDAQTNGEPPEARKAINSTQRLTSTTQLMTKFVETFPGVPQFTHQLVKKIFL